MMMTTSKRKRLCEVPADACSQTGGCATSQGILEVKPQDITAGDNQEKSHAQLNGADRKGKAANASQIGRSVAG